MSAENENKEILSEVWKALDNIDEAKQMFFRENFEVYERSVRKHQRN